MLIFTEEFNHLSHLIEKKLLTSCHLADTFEDLESR